LHIRYEDAASLAVTMIAIQGFQFNQPQNFTSKAITSPDGLCGPSTIAKHYGR